MYCLLDGEVDLRMEHGKGGGGGGGNEAPFFGTFSAHVE